MPKYELGNARAPVAKFEAQAQAQGRRKGGKKQRRLP